MFADPLNSDTILVAVEAPIDFCESKPLLQAYSDGFVVKPVDVVDGCFNFPFMDRLGLLDHERPKNGRLVVTGPLNETFWAESVQPVLTVCEKVYLMNLLSFVYTALALQRANVLAREVGHDASSWLVPVIWTDAHAFVFGATDGKANTQIVDRREFFDWLIVHLQHLHANISLGLACSKRVVGLLLVWACARKALGL